MKVQTDYCKPFVHNGIYDCKTCMNDAPYIWCCKTTCGEFILCKGCTKGIYAKENKNE